jgi:peptidoglycan/LPS O-acetylase OafA/YrhL
VAESEVHTTTANRALKLPHIRALDGVRGIAALAVVLTHTLTNGDFPSGRIMFLFHAGSYKLALGVDLFFVLSGYLITTLLLVARRHHRYYRNFYVKRAFRILPALYLVLAIIVPAFNFPVSSVIAALLFVANFAFVWGATEIGPFWTLAIEEQFYLLWPTVIRRMSPRSLTNFLAGLIIGCEVARAIAELGNHGRIGNRILHLDGLAWGALIALHAFRWRVPFRPFSQEKLWRSLYRYPLISALVMASAASVFRLMGFEKLNLSVTVASASFALLILYLITHEQSRVSRFLASGPLRFLGEISYMLYLSHAYWLIAIDLLIDRWLPSTRSISGYLLRPAICLGVSIGWSALSLRFFEKPIARLRRSFLA